MEKQGQTIQWFPGHMARTRRKIKESLSLVDMVIEIVDARIPASSRNPALDEWVAGKPRLIVLNKADMADEAATKQWSALWEQQGNFVLAGDCKTGKGMAQVVPKMQGALADKRAAWKEKGMENRAIRAMVVGIPNVGKSSFINRMTVGGKARVEDRPGVTRGNQWFSVKGGVLLLDTPGVLWPKFEDQTVARRLAYTGAVRDQVLDVEELACDLLEVLARAYPHRLRERYKLGEDLPQDGYELLQQIGKKRGMLIAGGEIHTERAAIAVLDEYRGGKMGPITLEWPEAKS